MAKVKCQFCDSDAKVFFKETPLCQNCIKVVKMNVDRIVEAIKEDNLRQDDRREVGEIERRYTKALQVKGSD